MSACSGSRITLPACRRGACSAYMESQPFRSEIAVGGCGFRTEAAEAPGTGEPGPGIGRKTSRVTRIDCGRPSAALHRRLPQRLEFPPDHEQGRCIEDRAVCARHDADQERERNAL